ncbi:putative protein kinase RLK-Pelle-RLCK-XI family [Helianthus annuus]|nr:putative protein kinase RLK-Pelle-RLCK-XI family [Helianthus annuus]
MSSTHFASPSPQPPPPPPYHHHLHLIPPITVAFSFLLALTFCFRKCTTRKRTVYRGTLTNNQNVAVKVMDAGSLQGEREFQNEILFAGKIESEYIVTVIGFSSDRKRRRMVLVYELMNNGSLQDCLLVKKCVELKEWKRRRLIAIDIAKGIEYLHHYCDPVIIHGDIKPSNILLDCDFNAKIGDLGLARLKSEDECRIDVNCKVVEDNGSVFEETESVVTTTTVCEEFSVGGADNRSPESCFTVPVAETSPETVTQSPRIGAGGDVDAMSVESERRRKKSVSGKDYVMEWIGSEIKKERPKTEWIATGASSSAGETGKSEKKKKNRRRLDWWITLDEEKNEKNVKKPKRRPAREWWKEEYCDELARKKKKNQKKMKESSTCNTNDDEWWPKDDELYTGRKKKRSRSRGSKGSVDWWLDGFSGELWRTRHNSHDSVSGDIPKSGGISSTPSMRGTVCYVAPEYSCGGDLSEKCDVYSFGVLLLVLIAGRRPLQVTGSPMSEFQRANLLSWARHLARAGKLLDLVDQSVQNLDREQALVCIVVALLCLQKSPALRPSMKEVVAMLSGELEPPPLPVEYSPSPPSRFKSHRKAR